MVKQEAIFPPDGKGNVSGTGEKIVGCEQGHKRSKNQPGRVELTSGIPSERGGASSGKELCGIKIVEPAFLSEHIIGDTGETEGKKRSPFRQRSACQQKYQR